MEDLSQSIKCKYLNKKFIVPVVYGLLFSTAVVASFWARQAMGKLELLSLWAGLLAIAALGIFFLSKLSIDISSGGGQRFLKREYLV